MIDDFGIELKNYDVGLFYFAGHGVQVKGTNYLIPIDANLQHERAVEYDCVNANRVLSNMEEAAKTLAQNSNTIIEMFQEVRSKVSEKSNGEQMPWESTSLTGNFYL